MSNSQRDPRIQAQFKSVMTLQFQATRSYAVNKALILWYAGTLFPCLSCCPNDSSRNNVNFQTQFATHIKRSRSGLFRQFGGSTLLFCAVIGLAGKRKIKLTKYFIAVNAQCPAGYRAGVGIQAGLCCTEQRPAICQKPSGIIAGIDE